MGLCCCGMFDEIEVRHWFNIHVLFEISWWFEQKQLKDDTMNSISGWIGISKRRTGKKRTSSFGIIHNDRGFQDISFSYDSYDMKKP